MKRKTIDAARETRLWIGQVIVPGVVTLGAVLSIPEVREVAATKARCAKECIQNKFRKEKRS